MAMPQDLVGKLVQYAVTAQFSPDMSHLRNGVLADQVVPTTLPLYDIVGAVGGPQGRQIKPAGKMWSFGFLKYVPGYVTTGPLTGPLLTGPMSGCYLCRYTEEGVNSLSHIGTVDSPDDPGTIAAKKAWKAFVARSEVTNVSGASPAGLYGFDDLQRLMFPGAPAPTVLGYFDTLGNAYAMAFARVQSAIGTGTLQGMLKIADVTPMPLSPWSTLAALPKFKD